MASVYFGAPVWWARGIFRSKVDECVPRIQLVDLRVVWCGWRLRWKRRRSRRLRAFPRGTRNCVSASERRGNTLKGCKGFALKAKARTWPCMSYVGHVRSTADTWPPTLLAVQGGVSHRPGPLYHSASNLRIFTLCMYESLWIYVGPALFFVYIRCVYTLYM